jgi:hypothetical protein
MVLRQGVQAVRIENPSLRSLRSLCSKSLSAVSCYARFIEQAELSQREILEQEMAENPEKGLLDSERWMRWSSAREFRR